MDSADKALMLFNLICPGSTIASYAISDIDVMEKRDQFTHEFSRETEDIHSVVCQMLPKSDFGWQQC